jgi:hypothetical protein
MAIDYIPRVRRFLFLVVLLPLLLEAAPVYPKELPYKKWQITPEVRQRLEAIRSKGEPVTWSELNAWWPAVADDRNAEVHMRQVFENFKEKNFDELYFKISDNVLEARPNQKPFHLPYPPGHLERVQNLVNQYGKTLERMHREIPRELRLPPQRIAPNVRLPHLISVKYAMNLLGYECIVRLEAGQPRKAARAVRHMYGLSRQMEGNPTLIDHLFRMALSGITHSKLRRVLNRAPLTRAELKAIAADLNRLDFDQDLSHAWAAERALFLPWLFLPPGSQASKNDRFEVGVPVKNKKEYIRRHQALKPAQLAEHQIVLLDFYKQLEATMKLPIHQRLDAQAGLEKFLEKRLPRHLPELNSFIEDQYVMASMFNKTAWHEANRRCARVAVALEQYRLDHKGRLPKKLAALTPKYLPAISADPFDGKPLRYMLLKDNHGYVVYSVGKDRKDDGGVDYDFEKESGDQTFRVQRELSGR